MEYVTEEGVRQLINKLKYVYRLQMRLPVIPWASRHMDRDTVRINDVFIEPEINTLMTGKTLTLDDIFITSRNEETTNTNNRIVIKGRTGSGKSTLLLKISSDWADGKCVTLKDCQAVFLLKLMNLDHNSNIGEAIVNHLFRNKQFSPRFIESFIEDNQKTVAILLDGYDEFKGKGLKQEQCGNIVKMLRKEYLPDVQLIVTTRPGRVNDFMTLSDESREYRILEVTGFSSSAIDDYINKTLKQQPLSGKELIDFLEESHLKMDLACLPLMCCAFCQLAKWTDVKDFKNIITTSSLLENIFRYLIEYRNTCEVEETTTENVHVENEPRNRLQNLREHGKGQGNSEKGDVSKHAFLLDLGKVALNGFLKSENEELLFTPKDFEACESKGSIVEWGCKSGFLFRDDDQETPGLESNYNEGQNIRFTLKIFQEKLAGVYLAHLLGQRKTIYILQWIKKIFEKRRIYVHFKSISKQRILDLKNVFLFACGDSVDAARVIISLVVEELKSRGDEFDLFLKGELHFEKMIEVTFLFEFCLQLNHESQSKGSLNNILKPLFDNCKRIRLVETTPFIVKYVGYLMKYSEGLSIQALEIILLSFHSDFALYSSVTNLPGVESIISNKLFENLEDKSSQDRYFGEEYMRKEIRENIAKGINVPKHLLMMLPAHLFSTFIKVFELSKMKERRKLNQRIIQYILPGIKTRGIHELILTGFKEELADEWHIFFSKISQSSTLKKLSLINDGLEDEQMSALLAALSFHPDLIHLDLSGNKIGNVLVEWLVDHPLKKLETLILQNTEMSSQSLERLGKILPRFPALKTLDIFSNVEVDDSALLGILDSVIHCPGLERLFLSLNSVTKNGIEYLNMLSVSSLKMLQLLGTPFPQETIQCVSNILPRLDKLEELWINHKLESDTTSEVISLDVAQYFAEAISNTHSLKVVKVLYIKFDAESLFYFVGKTDIESRITRLQEFW